MIWPGWVDRLVAEPLQFFDALKNARTLARIHEVVKLHRPLDGPRRAAVPRIDHVEFCALNVDFQNRH
jgi:hypothetical protein